MCIRDSANDELSKIDCMKNGFLVIPFKLPEVLKKPMLKDAFHYMFIKKHQTKQESEMNSLFVVNIPLLTNLDIMKTVTAKICERYDTMAHVENLLYNDEFGLNEINLSALTSDLLTDTNDQSESRFTPRNTCLLYTSRCV